MIYIVTIIIAICVISAIICHFSIEITHYDVANEKICSKGESQMIVSRGLGYGKIKFRIFNKPEIVVVTLKK